MTDKIYYTHNDFKKSINTIISKINRDNWKPDMIFGLSRGGLPMGVYLSHYFNVPLIPLMLSLRDHKMNFLRPQLEFVEFDKINNILITEDIVDSGDTIKEFMKTLKLTMQNDTRYLFMDLPKIDFRLAASFYNTSNKQEIQCDYYDKEIDRNIDKRWIVFDHENL